MVTRYQEAAPPGRRLRSRPTRPTRQLKSLSWASSCSGQLSPRHRAAGPVGPAGAGARQPPCRPRSSERPEVWTARPLHPSRLLPCFQTVIKSCGAQIVSSTRLFSCWQKTNTVSLLCAHVEQLACGLQTPDSRRHADLQALCPLHPGTCPRPSAHVPEVT